MRYSPKVCPNCTFPHAGPWVRCFMCGHDLILAELARMSSELAQELKEDNDRAEEELKLQNFRQMTAKLDPRGPVWGTDEYPTRMDHIYQQWKDEPREE